jgi:ribosomal protein S12 methylthiotransferase
MGERRNELLAVQEDIAAARGKDRVGSVMEVLVEGVSEETDLLLEGRHEGLAPEIDGVVYINDGSATAGELVKVEITDAALFDLVGHIVS